MAARTVIYAILAGFATLVVTFILTNVLYIEWADWRYPETNSMAGMSAFVLGIIVAPVCAVVSFALVLVVRRKTLM
jgi:hypothetical protein